MEGGHGGPPERYPVRMSDNLRRWSSRNGGGAWWPPGVNTIARVRGLSYRWAAMEGGHGGPPEEPTLGDESSQRARVRRNGGGAWWPPGGADVGMTQAPVVDMPQWRGGMVAPRSVKRLHKRYGTAPAQPQWRGGMVAPRSRLTFLGQRFDRNQAAMEGGHGGPPESKVGRVVALAPIAPQWRGGMVAPRSQSPDYPMGDSVFCWPQWRGGMVAPRR